MSDNKKRSYDVGYRRPPRATQFKKGQSGNLKGRRKGSKNLESLFRSTLEEPVTVTESGERKTITKLQAAIKQVVNRAASGDPRATQLLLGMVQLNDDQAQSSSQSAVLDSADQEVIAGVIARIRRLGRQGSDGGANAS